MDMQAIGERLRIIRGRHSRASFSERIGLHANTLRNYESGIREIGGEALLRYIDIGVSPLWILTGCGDVMLSPDLLPSKEFSKSEQDLYKELNSIFQTETQPLNPCQSNEPPLSMPERIRAERLRLDKTQEEFANLGDVTRQSQSKYENGTRIPDANYLSKLAAHGLDSQFVLTGKASDSNMNIHEPAPLSAPSMKFDGLTFSRQWIEDFIKTELSRLTLITYEEMRINGPQLADGMKNAGSSISSRLKEDRQRLNKKIGEVAVFCDVNPKTASRWENGSPIPSDKLAILGAMGFDLLYILNGVRSINE